MSNYIEVPIETDPQILAQEGFDYVQGQIPGWAPNDANLETIMIEAIARITAEARDVASAVPTDVFRYFGTLVGILSQDAASAVGSTGWTVINNAGYTIPGGTQIGIRTAGDVLVPFITDLDVVIPPGFTTVTDVAIHAVEPGSNASGLTGTVELIDTLDFVTAVTLDAPGTTGGVDAETEEEYLSRLSARLRLMAPRPIVPVDFAVLAQDVNGVERALAIDMYNPDHNILTANQSSLETDTTGWIQNGNCTISRVTSQAQQGAASLQLSSTAGGAMSAITDPITTYACVPGQFFAAIAQVRTASVVQQARVELAWYTSGSVLISSTLGTYVNDSSSAWTQISVSGSAPATAAYVRVAVRFASTGGAAEIHYVDAIALRHTMSLDWAIGGTVELNNERYVTVVLADDDGNPVGSTIKAEADAYLQARRELNFVIKVIDPTYTTIDVNFIAVAKVGFTPADVETAAEKAVTDYLSRATWGIPTEGTGDILSARWIDEPVVRYLELAQVVNNVSGVNYVSTLTLRKSADSFASADVALNGVGAMPTAGVISGSVT